MIQNVALSQHGGINQHWGLGRRIFLDNLLLLCVMFSVKPVMVINFRLHLILEPDFIAAQCLLIWRALTRVFWEDQTDRLANLTENLITWTRYFLKYYGRSDYKNQLGVAIFNFSILIWVHCTMGPQSSKSAAFGL